VDTSPTTPTEITKNIGGVDYVQRNGQWFKK